ncbi:type I-E CRISPR-associated protein Cas7/Cse4/CasC [Streptomyces sp. NBC_01803]|uniref:type I-E CRISPR-associated protein Cas7/Cse4/CasC n=1 Tax=Streptomyces sp. NBC_01803 TaxID=2975946 RepID=UPI002DDBC674|nr:type I-E CRISPR-associated protein Cas7/Cse4/CasC [Streptomyces sp. NBC_01803]WSA46453.1 type I-E CRISPR-associated protein Cas7/Cse4/CasC [Streptomyces sp. NBC_01803]
MSHIPGRFVELHVLQSVPYANLNRDDTNSVKLVEYGGVSRTRVSSQSWKRAARLRLQQRIGQRSLRTRRLPELIERHLVEERQWPLAAAARAGRHVMAGSGVGVTAPKKEPERNPWTSAAMVYVPDTAVAELADIAEEFRSAIEAAKDTKDIKAKDALVPGDRVDAVLRSRNGIVNLFGRMLAQVDNAKVDGAVQVAHAFTTHRTDVEIDYFSAVDDVTHGWEDTTGSAHMGHAEHSAGTFYRYIVLDLDDLLHNIGGDLTAARELAEAFLDAALLSLPQAKKNSTAPHTIPDLAHITVRGDRPVSYAGAFETPVRPDAKSGGHLGPSIAELTRYASAVERLLGKGDQRYCGYAAVGAEELNALGKRVDSFGTLVREAVTAALGTVSRDIAA